MLHLCQQHRFAQQKPALIQTFPIDFQFGENQMEAEQMIGNAVPVNLAYHVANALSAFENKRENATAMEFSDWLRMSYGYSSLAIKDTISRVGRELPRCA